MKTAAVFGATGLIGTHLVQLLCNSNEYGKVYSFARRKPENQPEKVEYIDFLTDLLKIPNDVDTVFVCLGTTIKKAGTQEAFLKIDYDMVVEIAKQSKLSNVKRFIVVSSIGANPNTNNFYLQTKGRMEEAVKQLQIDYCGIVRPSLLFGNRIEFRFGERVAIALFKIFSFIFVGPLKKYKGIYAEDVAKGMIMLARSEMGNVTIESNIIKQLADEYTKQQ
ncbi:MAG TPA: oxidoreductase [Bacteroidales bacterium]|nr:oxidoreductase [Bacteroidales bacterium]